MKTSNKVLLTTGITVVVVVVALVFVARSYLGDSLRGIGASDLIIPSGSEVTKSYELTGFDSIESGGAWTIELRKASEYGATVTVSDNVADRLDVYVSGRTLHLGLKSGVAVGKNGLFRAQISMPLLESLSLSGAIQLNFTGFSGERLTVKSSGAASIRGDDGRYASIDASSSGAAMIMLRGITVSNANIEMSGAGSTQLTIDGGSLSGSLSGASRLLYYGSAAQVEVKTSGLAQVSKG